MGSSKKTEKSRKILSYLKSKSFQRILTICLTLAAAFAIIQSGAAPKKYKLQLSDKSSYDIDAPRDIENTLKTQERAEEAKKAVPPVMKYLSHIPGDVLSIAYDFVTEVDKARKGIDKALQEREVNKKSPDYATILEEEQEKAVKLLELKIKEFNIPLSQEQVRYLVTRALDEDLSKFRDISVKLFNQIMSTEITQENLAEKINAVQNSFQGEDLNQELKNIGALLAGAIMKPNSIIDIEQTEAAREDAYNKALENKVMIYKKTRILSVGDIVTEDKYQVIKDLNLLETSRFDYSLAVGLLIILVLLTFALILFIHHFCKKVVQNRNEVLLLCVIIILTLLISRVVYAYSALMVPIFIASMLISILIDVKLAVFVNLILGIALSFITKDDMRFLYMAMISGTFSAFFVSKANQRSKLSAAGLLVAATNTLIIVCMGMINKNDFRTIAYDSATVSFNGLVSAVLTIGFLPFFEAAFNVITPLKLLEMANPNQPLIKRLLMEAPGTYHHSLMVGNLAEMAAEAIDGNALLARVGAYYHDIGKLKRPVFFKENQMTDNPHDRMTANLSTLVITSHTKDGIELAKEYKLPSAIKDIICQHHGNTLVAYFYHKAKKDDKAESVKQEDYRYEGPRPATKEAAVVMLADSVEAAVRSMTDRTEGKIEGLVRKIIKDKLDDGQLDQCELTLKDLDNIARSFMRVFSGYFHAREEYPEVKVKSTFQEDPRMIGIEDDQKEEKILPNPEDKRDFEEEKEKTWQS